MSVVKVFYGAFMRKVIKLLTIVAYVVILVSFVTGCLNIKNVSFLKSKSTTYFHKGVYKSYSLDSKSSYKNYFYIFNNKNSGHTEEIERGIGLPFSCVQANGYVKFKFGGVDASDEIFKVKSAKNGIITGFFENGLILIFVPIANANPDNFDAVEYAKKHNIIN